MGVLEYVNINIVIILNKFITKVIMGLFIPLTNKSEKAYT